MIHDETELIADIVNRVPRLGEGLSGRLHEYLLALRNDGVLDPSGTFEANRERCPGSGVVADFLKEKRDAESLEVSRLRGSFRFILEIRAIRLL